MLVSIRAFAGAFAATLIACAAPLPQPAPQPTIAAAIITVAPRESAESPAPIHDAAPRLHHVAITVEGLPKPQTLNAMATSFVVWVRANDDDAWANAAHLDPSDEPQIAEFAHAPSDLHVEITAETAPDVRLPSPNVLLSTHVSTHAACAASADAQNARMRVRMCRDEN